MQRGLNPQSTRGQRQCPLHRHSSTPCPRDLLNCTYMQTYTLRAIHPPHNATVPQCHSASYPRTLQGAQILPLQRCNIIQYTVPSSAPQQLHSIPSRSPKCSTFTHRSIHHDSTLLRNVEVPHPFLAGWTTPLLDHVTHCAFPHGPVHNSAVASRRDSQAAFSRDAPARAPVIFATRVPR